MLPAWKIGQQLETGRVSKVKSSFLAAAASLAMVIGTIAPALADDTPLDKVVEGSLLVTRVAGVGSGVVLGTPVGVVRTVVKEYIGMTGAVADKVGGKDCGPCCLLVSVGTIPASLVWGGAKGVYYGGKNGIMHGFNEPFSPASFCLGKYDE